MTQFANASAETIPVKLTRTRAHPGADMPHEGLMDRIKAITPLIASKAHEVESLRHPHDEVMEALQATGVFKSFVAKEYGGYEIDVTEFVDIGLEVAQACCSTGWLTTFYMEHNYVVGISMSDEAIEEIFSRQPYIVAPGSVNPKGGQAVKVDGGYEISGRWNFNSGAVHGDWVILTAIIPGDVFLVRTFLLPREEVRIEDTWNTAGMRGTGSHDAVVDNVFVPEKFTSPFPPPKRSSDKYTHYDMYRLPPGEFLSLAAAIPLVGAAKRAVTVFRERLASRVSLLTGAPQQEKVSAQIRLGNVAMEVRKAEMMLRESARQLEAITVRSEEPSEVESAELRMMNADAVRVAKNAVISIIEASGAHAHFEGSELQRIYRDVLTGSGHIVFDIDAHTETYGSALIDAYNEDNEAVDDTSEVNETQANSTEQTTTAQNGTGCDGTWKVTIDSPMGAQEGTLTLKSSGNSLSGTMVGERGTEEFKGGIVKGNELAWQVKVKVPRLTLKFKASVDGDKISGTVKVGMFGKANFEGART
jgi:3-hydroxy-9,10-secoandrosta-1,3,5(10)-triene-9,17-dione monooxygenase